MDSVPPGYIPPPPGFEGYAPPTFQVSLNNLNKKFSHYDPTHKLFIYFILTLHCI